MDVSRRHALTFEVLAVTGWILLPRLGASRIVVPRYPDAVALRHLDPRGLATIGSIGHMLGSLCLLAYIIWNSADPPSYFGIVRPKWIDLAYAIGFAALLASVAICRDLLVLGHFHLQVPKLSAARQVYLTLTVILTSAAFQGLVFNRVRDLMENSFVAAAAAALCLASYLGMSDGGAGFVNELLEGALLAAVFLVRRSLWPVILGRVLLFVFLEARG